MTFQQAVLLQQPAQVSPAGRDSRMRKSCKNRAKAQFALGILCRLPALFPFALQGHQELKKSEKHPSNGSGKMCRDNQEMSGVEKEQVFKGREIKGIKDTQHQKTTAMSLNVRKPRCLIVLPLPWVPPVSPEATNAGTCWKAARPCVKLYSPIQQLLLTSTSPQDPNSSAERPVCPSSTAVFGTACGRQRS